MRTLALKKLNAFHGISGWYDPPSALALCIVLRIWLALHARAVIIGLLPPRVFKLTRVPIVHRRFFWNFKTELGMYAYRALYIVLSHCQLMHPTRRQICMCAFPIPQSRGGLTWQQLTRAGCRRTQAHGRTKSRTPAK